MGKRRRGQRIGNARGKFEVPDNIDPTNDEVALLAQALVEPMRLMTHDTIGVALPRYRHEDLRLLFFGHGSRRGGPCNAGS